MKTLTMVVVIAYSVLAYAEYALTPAPYADRTIGQTSYAHQPAPVAGSPIVAQAPSSTYTGAPSYPGQPRVWVPGKYVSQTLQNGTSVLVWVPGYWQWR